MQDDAPDDGKSKSAATQRDPSATAADPASFATGAVVADRYEIGRVLGPGVAGKVYAVRDRQTGRDVALEVLAGPWVASETARQRFIREFSIARSLSHTHIVHVHDVGATTDCVYLSMELLKGRSLRRRLAMSSGTPIALQEVFSIARQLIDALQHARRIIVHRDLKPENIWLSEDGTVKVMGFGIARALLAADPTASSQTPQHAHYLAPEQTVSAKDVDWRADQYALAVILYELLTRSLPTEQPTVESLATLRADVPPRFGAALMRALSPNPEERWPDWETLQAELAVPKRAPLRVAAFAALGLLGAAASGFYFYSREPQVPATPSSFAAAPQLADGAGLAHEQQLSAPDSTGDSPPVPARATEEASTKVAVAAGGEGARLSNAAADARGQEIFARACVACHGSGVAGAPMLGDAIAWGPRVAQGSSVLYERALQGYQGKSGFMPPKGGRVDLSDQSVIDAVDYMVAHSKTPPQEQ